MNIVFISYNKFPNGDAGAIREYMFGKMLKLKEHNIYFIGMGNSNIYETKNYNEFQYTSLRLNYSNKFGKLNNYLGYSKRLEKFLKYYILNHRIDIFWIVYIPINALFKIKSYAKKNNIKLIHDSVEWYSPEQFKLGKLSPEYIMKNIYNRYLINDNFIVVSISKYLENHFINKKIKTIRIPIVFDKDEICYEKNVNNKRLTILYAGLPGKKDYLNIMLNGLVLLNKDQLNNIEFRVIGVNLFQIKDMFENNKDSLDKILNCLNILGRISREEVIENLSHSDFTVLLRSSEQRYAKAGFPTKVVESLATGTPAILNITSDLGDYIIDGVNGLIINGCTAKAFCEAINKAYNLSLIDKKSMQDNSRITFEKNFDYRLYSEILNSVISCIP